MSSPGSTGQNHWYWAVLLSKAYVMAVPMALCLYTALRPSEAWLFHGHSAFDREQARILTPVLCLYLVSVVGLLLCGVFAPDRKARRSALLFAALGLLSLLVLYPASVVPAVK